MMAEETDNTQQEGKRPYTMTDKALAARRANAQQSTGPVTEEGKAISSRNAWKHGEYSQAARTNEWLDLGALYKPCKSTCVKFDTCPLVAEGKTQPGGDCLDKEVFVEAFGALMSVMQNGDAMYAHGMLAMQQAGAIEILEDMRRAISGQVMIERPIINKSGDPVINSKTNEPYTTLEPNPIIGVYIKMLFTAGINLPELMATPKAQAALKEKKADEDAMAALLRQIGAGASTFSKPPIDMDAEVVE